MVNRADALQFEGQLPPDHHNGIRRTLAANVSAHLTARLSALDTNITAPFVGSNAGSYAWNLWVTGGIATLAPHYFYIMVRSWLMEDPNAQRPPILDESIWNRAVASMANEDGTGHEWMSTRCDGVSVSNI